MILQTSSSSIFLPTIYVVLLSTANTILGFTNETDRQALIAFKAEIASDPFEALNSWNDSIHFCHWNGIKCNLRHQRVTVLNLSSFELIGSLSPSVANLTFLKAVVLDNNSFHGEIPQEIGRLFRLQSLLLFNNTFQGELPSSLANCSSVRVVDVRKNNLVGPIPQFTSSLSMLLELSLSDNNFSGIIPPSLGNLSALRILSLSNNLLQGSIPSEIGWLSDLRYFELSSNSLSGSVAPRLCNSSSIQYFSLSSNLLNGTFPPHPGFTLGKLRIFRIRQNQFSGQIPESITNSSGLEQLDMGINVFSGPIPSNLESLSNLQVLHLNGNQLTGALPNSIANLSTKLTSLRLDQNNISGGLPEEIGNLINLQNLVTSENMLTGKLPDSIGRLTKLQGINISKNKFFGIIPSSIGNITRLSILSMGQNMLQGNIPISLGNCTYLQGLDLSYNQLTGNIPFEILTLYTLSLGLNLGWNQLSGPLLNVDLGNLGTLDISNNNLSGNLPPSIANLQVLEFLYVQGNLFTGTIPSSLGSLRGIQALDLSCNKFSGKIPRDFSNFPFIRYLNLSHNMLEGQVPDEGVFSNSSAFSILENKRLCGGLKSLALPSCPKKGSKKRIKLSSHVSLLTIILIGGSVVLFMLLACICATYFWAGISESLISKMSESFSRNNSEMRELESPLGNQYPQFTYAQLLQATDGFSQAKLIGKGSYGFVYKGTLSLSGQVVAVKVLNLRQNGANKSFVAECEALRMIRHRNLIKIVTACSGIDFQGRDFKALVYEFMPNGSLESWLHPNPWESKHLNLIQRLDIAIDVASALHYLHNSCETPIIHRDIKPGNILLDDELCAHVSDFGLARFLLVSAERSKRVRSDGIAGTVGYIALEFGVGGPASTLVDVYSYGILLLEMFTGKKPTDSLFKDDFSIHNYVKGCLPDERS